MTVTMTTWDVAHGCSVPNGGRRDDDQLSRPRIELPPASRTLEATSSAVAGGSGDTGITGADVEGDGAALNTRDW